LHPKLDRRSEGLQYRAANRCSGERGEVPVPFPRQRQQVPRQTLRFTFLLSKLENVLKQKSFPLFTTSQLLNSISLLKPQVDLPRPPEPQLTPLQLQAEKVMAMDVIDELDEMIREILKLAGKREGLEALQGSLVKQIEKY
jgi:hypothetical protein